MKNGKSIGVSEEDLKALEEARKQYLASRGIKSIGWGKFLVHITENITETKDAQVLTTDIPSEQSASLAQPAATLEKQEVIIPVIVEDQNEPENIKEKVVCNECDKKSAEITSLNEKVATLERQMTEKADTIPEDLSEVINHCESGKCQGHNQQWEKIKAGIVEANKPAIIQATLENLPDSVIEAEGLKRGFIPKQIIVPMARR